MGQNWQATEARQTIAGPCTLGNRLAIGSRIEKLKRLASDALIAKSVIFRGEKITH